MNSSSVNGEEYASLSRSVEKPDPELEEWRDLERFAAQLGLDPYNGADFERAMILMHQRKPVQPETGLSLAASSGSRG